MPTGSWRAGTRERIRSCQQYNDERTLPVPHDPLFGRRKTMIERKTDSHEEMTMRSPVRPGIVRMDRKFRIGQRVMSPGWHPHRFPVPDSADDLVKTTATDRQSARYPISTDEGGGNL